MSIGSPLSLRVIFVSGKSKSIEPLLYLFSLKILASSSINLNMSTKSLYSLQSSSSLSSIFLTLVYVILLSILTTVSHIFEDTTLPFSSISMRQLSASLSCPWLSEHIPLDNLCGSIGITLSTRYTLVPLLYASLSRALFSFT